MIFSSSAKVDICGFSPFVFKFTLSISREQQFIVKHVVGILQVDMSANHMPWGNKRTSISHALLPFITWIQIVSKTVLHTCLKQYCTPLFLSRSVY